MRLVVDTNVLIAGLLRDGVTRALLTSPKVVGFVPDHGDDEVLRHLDDLAIRLELPRAEVAFVVSGFLGHLEVVAPSRYAPFLAEAVRKVGALDPDDIPFVALARALGCPLWSNDKRLGEQAWVEVLSTPEVLRRLGG